MGAASSSTRDTIPPNPNIWQDKTLPANTITGTMLQTQAYGVYNNDCSHCNTTGCDSGDCSTFTQWADNTEPAKIIDATGTLYIPNGLDYQEYEKSCALTCPSKPYYTRANILQCALGSKQGQDEPTYRVDWAPGTGKRITCTYDMDKIVTPEQVQRYIDLFNPQPGDPSYDKLMMKMCSMTSNHCMIDPTTKLLVDSCSKLTCTNDDPMSKPCKTWYYSMDTKARDAFIANHCASNTSLAECKCQNRTDMPVYVAVKPYISDAIADACVFVPCKGSPVFLVNSQDAKPTCPAQLCEQIYNVQNVDGPVTIQNNQNYMACVYNADSGHTEVPRPPKPSTPPVVNYNMWWIVYAAITVIIIVLLIV
jgi:hypothetical protein